MIDEDLVRKARAARERLARAAERAEREIERAEGLLAEIGLGAPIWIPLGPRIVRGADLRSAPADELCLGYSDEGDGRWAIKVGLRAGGPGGRARRTRPVRALPRAEQAAALARVRALVEEALRAAERLADELERGTRGGSPPRGPAASRGGPGPGPGYSSRS